MKKVFRILFLISSMLFIYIALNLDNSSLYRCGHIGDLKKINLFWNTILFDISIILLSTILLLSLILGMTYFIVYSDKISSIFSKIVNIRFYLKYKGTNWTRKEAKSLVSRKFKLKTIVGEVLFLSNKDNKEYAVKKTTDSNGRKIFVFLIDKEVVSKSEYISLDRFSDYIPVFNSSFRLPESVLNIVSVFKDFRTVVQNGYLYVVLPEGYYTILSREEIAIIRNSFPGFEVDFAGTYFGIIPKRNRSIYF